MDTLVVDDALVPDISYLIGLDLAQGGSDYTALSVIERTEPIDGSPATYACVHLDRWRDRETRRIPQTVALVTKQLGRVVTTREFERTGTGRGVTPDIRLVVDQTGVGPFGTDPLKRAGFDPIGITIHGGDAVSHPAAHTYRVPKRDLAGAVNTLLESQRLRIANALPEATTLRAELENFRATINIATGHDSYAAGASEGWREGAHDDLVLSVAIAVWLGEWRPPPRLDMGIADAWTDLPG